MWQLTRWHGQPAMGGATSLCIASVSKGIVDMAARSRMSREVHVRSLWGTGGEIPPVYPATALKGHRTLLLFWNPTCGFCEAMLDDVKTWETSRAKDSPELVVISGGSPK